MAHAFSLSRKIDLTLLVALVLAVVSYALIILISSERLEHSLLDTLVESEADLLGARLAENPEAVLPQQNITLAWLSRAGHDHTPAQMRRLSIGLIHNLDFEGRRYHVLRRQIAEGVLTVAVDISAMEKREGELQAIIVMGGLGIIVLLFFALRGLSHRLAMPLQALAAELDKTAADTTDASFAARYDGAEAGRIAAALDRFIHRQQALIERERSFSSAASHELRSPVTVIRGGLELALLNPDLPDAARPPLQRAFRNSEQLGQILEGLLVLARDPDDLDTGEIDADAILMDLVEEWRHDAEAPPVDLQVTRTPVLRCPESHWRILITNLLRNARDHAAGQSIHLQLNEHALTVRDHGPGIDPDLLDQVFERSRRGAHSGGSGLGLYIAAEICKRQNWRIQARNAEPRGCVIEVTFAP